MRRRGEISPRRLPTHFSAPSFAALRQLRYPLDQPLQRRVPLALRQADDLQVKRPQGEEQFEQLQRQQRLLVNNPREMTEAQALAIYQAAY